ncbi:hypothetical protein, partial [Bradyrhizobium sp. USDA 4504]
MIGVGIPSFQFNEINGLKGPDDADGGHFSISIHSLRRVRVPEVRAPPEAATFPLSTDTTPIIPLEAKRLFGP